MQLGVALGLAVDAKPWALALLPLAFALPSRRRGLSAAFTAFGVVLVAWVPFLVFPGTLEALNGFRIPVSAQSPLTLLGVDASSPMPGWVRPAQLVLGLTMCAIVVARGRPSAALLVVVAARVALDAGAFPYYYTGLVIGALLWELTGTNRWLPVLTGALCLAEFDIKWLLPTGNALAWCNLGALLLAMTVLVTPQPLRSAQAPPSGWSVWVRPSQIREARLQPTQSQEAR
jgi:hypothetical protein